jgi:hypothetical protein
MDSQRPFPITAFLLTAVAVGAFILIALDRSGLAPSLRAFTNQFYIWLILLGAVALIIGVTNVVWVHLQHIRAGAAGWGNSLALVSATGIVLAAGLITAEGTSSPLVEWIFDGVILPGQATLFALLAFFMAAAAYRYLRVGRTGGAWMLTGALLVLLVQMPAANSILPQSLISATVWLVDTPVMAAVRGALLGGSVALLVAAISFMLRQD